MRSYRSELEQEVSHHSSLLFSWGVSLFDGTAPVLGRAISVLIL
jgi:hypothetical protein